MRARNREINVFSVSTLDVFCGAMGAFLIIMLSLLGQAQAAGESEDNAQAEAMQEQLALVATWEANADVDLIVVYPGGWSGPKEGLMAEPRTYTFNDDQGQTLPAWEWFGQNQLHAGDVWTAYVTLSSAPPPAGVTVRGTATLNRRDGQGGHLLSSWVFGPVRLSRRGERRKVFELGLAADKRPTGGARNEEVPP